MSDLTSEFVAQFIGQLLRFRESREHLIDQIYYVPDNGMGWFDGDLAITGFLPASLGRFEAPVVGVTSLDASSLLVHMPYDIRGCWLDLAEEALVLGSRLPPAQPTEAHALFLAKAARRIGQLRRDRLPDPVHEDRAAGGWYFYDETWVDRRGPYATESAARRRLQVHTSYLDERITFSADASPEVQSTSEER